MFSPPPKLLNNFINFQVDVVDLANLMCIIWNLCIHVVEVSLCLSGEDSSVWWAEGTGPTAEADAGQCTHHEGHARGQGKPWPPGQGLSVGCRL